MKNVLLLLLVSTLSAVKPEVQTVEGTVSDADGPLPGVSVIVKGTTQGTQTDFNGRYRIAANAGDILLFSAIGYKQKSVKVKNVRVIDVVLELDKTALDEVVIEATEAEMPFMHKSRGVVAAQASSVAYPKKAWRHVNTHIPIGNTESYARITENTFERVALSPLSTFSIDVDRASYSNIRRMINKGETIPKDAVKIEEMINYFKYDYPQPEGPHPFAIQTDLAETPWNPDTRLVRIGLQGKDFRAEELPPANLTFLIDVSGSMNSANKLPLLKSAFKLLVNQLRRQDRVAIVVYAGAAGVVLPPTQGHRKAEILQALDQLQAGGSTAGGAGIERAYSLAEKHFEKHGNNRVILATDGDFNVGASSDQAMEDLISQKRSSGIFLSVLGFGMGNYKDSKLETLADKGNGNHAYIDTMQEAQKVFGSEFGGTLYTIAKDVKIQVEFNPVRVAAYRLIGYENRLLAEEDFLDDTKDAGELGSNHSVTALYEILPVGTESPYLKPVPELTYPREEAIMQGDPSSWFTVRFRYKKPEGDQSIEIVKKHLNGPAEMHPDFAFASSLALFGMQLRNSAYTNQSDLETVIALAKDGKGSDPEGYRGEFIRLVKTYGARSPKGIASGE